MSEYAGAATPDDTRYPNGIHAVFAHKRCAADAVIGGDSTIVRDRAAATATWTPTRGARSSNALADAGAVTMMVVAVLCSLRMC